MTTEQTSIPRLSRDEAKDLQSKIRTLGESLSPNQQAYLKYALFEAMPETEVRGYDYFTTEYFIGYYDAYGNFWATGEVDYDWNTGDQVEFDY